MTPFEDAWRRRAALYDDPETDTYRLFDGRWEGQPGWTVDRYGPVALVRRFTGAEDEPGVVAAYTAHGLSVVQRDRGAGGHARLVAGEWPPIDALLPRPGRFVVTEEALRFGVDLLHGSNTGLFLDARPLRSWVRRHASGRNLLNLFSYTSAFGVAAVAGGARSVTNVDIVASALERGRANYALNGFEADSRSHERSDVFETLRHARKRDRRWDAIVCDPPPVRTEGAKRGFDPSRDLRRVMQQSWGRVAPGGWLMVVNAVPGEERFEAVLPEAAWSPLDRGSDFPGARDRGMRAWVATRDG